MLLDTVIGTLCSPNDDDGIGSRNSQNDLCSTNDENRIESRKDIEMFVGDDVRDRLIDRLIKIGDIHVFIHLYICTYVYIYIYIYIYIYTSLF
jgi:hypothetical protein